MRRCIVGEIICPTCENGFVPKKKRQRFCSALCALTSSRKMKPPKDYPTRPCPVCGSEMNYLAGSRKFGRETCGKVCGNILAGRKRTGLVRSEDTRRKLSEAHTKVLDSSTERGRRLRKASSDRMKTNNPFTRPEVVARALVTKRINGTIDAFRSGNRGGNGKLTAPQILLATTLGWRTEVAIPTGHAPGDAGFPSNYKVDIANSELRIAIEVDGVSHNSKRIRTLDEKKVPKLASLGWRVLRFTNQAVMTDLSSVLLEIKSVVADT
jgi:endogenous inhibitor of DNA gyrase (YacG/DUF329 family)